MNDAEGTSAIQALSLNLKMSVAGMGRFAGNARLKDVLDAS